MIFRLLIAGLLAATCANARVAVGDRLPDLAVDDTAGKVVAPADLAGKVVLVDFWASWCMPCREAIPKLDALARRHAGQGLVVLAVGIDRDQKAADRFLAERLPSPTLRVVRDPEGKLMSRLGASGMPALFVADQGGVVRRIESGYEALDEIETEVGKLLGAERAPPP